MKLDELEKLADAAMSPAPYEREQGQADLKAVGVPQTIKQLIALCRLQHDALGMCDPHPCNNKYSEAIAAYERMNGGE